MTTGSAGSWHVRWTSGRSLPAATGRPDRLDAGPLLRLPARAARGGLRRGRPQVTPHGDAMVTARSSPLRPGPLHIGQVLQELPVRPPEAASPGHGRSVGAGVVAAIGWAAMAVGARVPACREPPVTSTTPGRRTAPTAATVPVTCRLGSGPPAGPAALAAARRGGYRAPGLARLGRLAPPRFAWRSRPDHI